MWLPIIGLALGVLLGSVLTITVPLIFAKYLSVAVLAALDSLLGGFRGILEESFDDTILLTGFFTNAMMAASLAYLGDHLGVDLYLAAVIAFGIRLFGNLGFIRRDLIARYKRKKAVQLKDSESND